MEEGPFREALDREGAPGKTQRKESGVGVRVGAGGEESEVWAKKEEEAGEAICREN